MDGCANDSIDALGCRWLQHSPATFELERLGQLLAIAAVDDDMIPQPLRKHRSVPYGRSTKAVERADLGAIALERPIQLVWLVRYCVVDIELSTEIGDGLGVKLANRPRETRVDAEIFQE